jgi:hypothetical protein
MKRFANAEAILQSKGYETINPARVNCNLPESTTWSEYMMMSLTMLSMCDTIYLLTGWEDSKGANLEYTYAKRNNYKIIKEPETTIA